MEVTRTLLLVAAAVSLPVAAGFTCHANSKHSLSLQLRQLHHQEAVLLTSLSMLSDQEAWELAQEQHQHQQRGTAHTQVAAAASGGPTTYRPDSISHGHARVVGPSTRHHEQRRPTTPKAAAINRGSSTKMRWESSASTSRAPPPPPPVQQRQQRSQQQQPTVSFRGTNRQQQQPKRSYFSDMRPPHRPRQAQPRPVAREQPPPPQRPTTTTTTRQHPSSGVAPIRPVRNPYYRPAPEEEPPQNNQVGYSPYGHTPTVHHHQQQQQQQQPQQSYYNQAPPQSPQEAPPSEYKQQQQRQQQPPPEYRQPQPQQQFGQDPTVATRAVMITNENRRILIEELGYPRRYVQAMNFEAARDIVAGRVRYQRMNK